MLRAFQGVLYLFVMSGYVWAADFSLGSPLSSSDSFSSMSSSSSSPTSPATSPSPTLRARSATPTRMTKVACVLGMRAPEETRQAQVAITGAVAGICAEHGYAFMKQRHDIIHLAELGTTAHYDQADLRITFNALRASDTTPICGRVGGRFFFTQADCFQSLEFNEQLATFITAFAAAAEIKGIKGLSLDTATMPAGIYLGCLQRKQEANMLSELTAKIMDKISIDKADITIGDLCIQFQNPSDASDR